MADVKPKVVIDARMVGEVPHGIARYVLLAAQGMEGIRAADLARFPFEPWYLVDPKINPAPSTVGLPADRCLAVSASFLEKVELFKIPRILRTAQASLYWSPSFSSLLPGIFGAGCPWVVTVHDLNHLHFGTRAQRLYYEFLLKPFCLKARKVLTVSEFSKGELLSWLELPEEKIEVVYNAVDPKLFGGLEKAKLSGPTDSPYFLCLGNPKPHKNLSILLEAYQEVRTKRLARGKSCWDLVVSGMSGPSENGVRFLAKIPDEELAGWIQGAQAMVFPSLYEGFGLPPVEAASLGVPVIVSDIPPHREGLRFAASVVEWFDPSSLESLVAKLDWFSDLEARRSVVANLFPVENLARSMVRVLSEALSPS